MPLGPAVWLYPEPRLDKASSPAEFVSRRREAEARGAIQAPIAPVPPAPALVDAGTPRAPEEEARGAAAKQIAAQREAYNSERSADLQTGESRRREGGSRAKLGLSWRLQCGLITEASSRAVIRAEEARRRDVMRSWDRAGVKEGYRRREIKKAERAAWKKLMGSCSGSEAGARRKTWSR